MANEHPTKLCECGCGRHPTIAKRTNTKRGRIKGKPYRFIRGHNNARPKIKHGRYGTPEYLVWRSLLNRCNNKNVPEWPRYGGRGITVCDSWHDFSGFFADMGERPTANHSIDRIDNDSGYSKQNCRWATRSEQQNNTRSNRQITAFGKTQTIMQWSRETSMGFQTLRQRLLHGWTAEEAISCPVAKYVRK